MDIKDLSLCQVYLAQELFYYLFQIEYYKKNANIIIDIIFAFYKKIRIKKKNFKLKIIKIFFICNCD